MGIDRKDFKKFRRDVWATLAMALVMPLSLGVAVLIFLGIWPFADGLKIFYQYTGAYFLLVSLPAILITTRFIREIQKRTEHARSPLQQLTYLKRLPLIFVVAELVYCLGGVTSGIVSMQDFGDRQYDPAFYAYSYFAVLPVIFIIILSVFFYASSVIGGFIAAHGIVVNVAPIWLKIVVLGLLAPALVDTTLLIYFYERTGHLTRETLALWSGLMLIAAFGTYLVITSLRQGLASLQKPIIALEGMQPLSDIQLASASLDELGVLTAGWKRLYDENIRVNLKLVESERRLRQLVEYTSDWIWEVDTKALLTYASPKVRDLLGYSPDEMLGCSVFDLVPEEEKDSVIASYEGLIRDRKPFYGMININRHKKGHFVMLEASGVPLFDDAGEWVGYRGIDRDISERYRYEQKLKQERNFTNAVLENAGALVMVLDKQGRIQRFNRACEEMSLYSAEEAIGRYKWDFLLLPEEVDAVKGVFAKLEKDKLPNEFTNYWVAKDRSLHLIKWSNVVMTDEKGEYDYLISIGVDITAQNIAQKTLAERSELLERIFENTHTLIAYMDTDFNFIRVNQAYLDADNKTEDQLIGRNHFDLYPNEENEKIFRQVVETGEMHFSYAKAFEYAYSPEKGVTHWDWSLSPIRNEQGEIVAVLLVLADVSQRIKAQEALLRNEEAMATAQSIAHFGSWDWDILTGELSWTDEIYRIFGQTPQSFPPTYEAFLDTIYADDRDDVVNAVNASVADSHVAYNIEHRVIRPTGEIRDVHEQGEVYRDENGRPIRMIGTVHDITERKQSEREMYLKDMAIQRSISAIAMGDLDANITYVNQSFLDIWGYEDNHEVLGRSAIDFWKNPEQVRVMILELREHGRWVGEMDAIRKDGSEMCIYVSANVTLDEQGRPLNMMASFIDVTEQKITEQALKLNQELLSKAQEIAHVGSWDWDIRTNALKWSEETYRIFGRKQTEFGATYAHFLETIPPDDRELVDATVHKCLEEPEREYRMVHRVLWPDGNVRIVLEQGVVYRDDEGQPIRMVGAVLDITEQKQAEEALRQSEERFQLAVHGSSDGLWDWNIVTGDDYFSPRFREILGYREEEDFPQVLDSFISRLHPDDKARVEDAITAHLERDEPYHIELRLRKKDGSYVWFLSRGQALRNESGQAVRMSGSVTDISERKRFIEELENYRQHLEDLVKERTVELEKTLQLVKQENEERKRVELSLVQAKNEAERANKLKSEFLGRMSHELRTPMNAILGFSQLLVMEDLDETTADYVSEISRAGKHLLDLINEVLDLSRIESGNIELIFGSENLNEIINDSISLVSSEADKKGISIQNNIMNDVSVIVSVDQTRFKEVIVNLLTNAIKYNRPQGKVVIDSKLLDTDMLRISISDTGPGIPEEKHQSIFEPFNRMGAEFTDIEGTGIGLTIAKQLIEMMHGRIGVESRPGEGSTFWIECPIFSERSKLPAQDKQAQKVRLVSNTYSLPDPQTVLYIEDNPANLRLVQKMLGRMSSIRLYSASNAELGIDLARSKQPALILMDINLPGMDGYEALSRLRMYPETSHIPVVALSAAAMPSDIERGKAAGFKHYLTKPLRVNALLQLLDKELGQGQISNQSTSGA